MSKILIIISILIHINIAHAEDGQPTGKNCNLIAPPESAGEVSNHGLTFKVFPRAKYITETYTGCQTFWAQMDSKWLLITALKIVKGDPKRHWSPHNRGSEKTTCKYSKGKLISGEKAKCPAPESLILKSLAPGCLEIKRKEGRFTDECNPKF